MSIDIVALITAVATLCGVLITGLLQFRKNKVEAKNVTQSTETDAAAKLIDKALTISKQEIDILRIVNVDIKEQLFEANKKIVCLEARVEQLTLDKEKLADKVDELERKLQKYIDKECN